MLFRRLAYRGVGAFVVVCTSAILMSSGPQTTPIAEAAGGCFTTPWGCYCVDFPLTLPKDRIWSRVQNEINDRMAGFNQDVAAGVKEAIDREVGAAVALQNTLSMDGVRNQLELSIGQRSQQALVNARQHLPSEAIPFAERAGRDIKGSTLAGRQAFAITEARSDSRNMAPYSNVSSQANSPASTSQQVSSWTDGIVLEAPDVEIPDDKTLAELPMKRLYALYEQVRQQMGARYARAGLQQLAASSQQIADLQQAQSDLDPNTKQIGVVQSALVHAQNLSALTRFEILKSELRKEASKGALVALRMEGFDE